MYAQKIEGDSWRGEKIDKGKIDKMSGVHGLFICLKEVLMLMICLDQQLGQLYELMQSIQKQGHDGNNGCA